MEKYPRISQSERPLNRLPTQGMHIITMHKEIFRGQADNLSPKGWKTTYAVCTPPHSRERFTTHFHLTQLFILHFQTLKGGGGSRGVAGVNSYSVGIKCIIFLGAFFNTICPLL